MTANVSEHPTRESLLEYAERVERGHVPFGSETATHISSCARCSDEVGRIRESIRLTRSIDDLEPSGALEASVLLAMKTHRHTPSRPAWMGALRSAAVVVVFVGLLSATVRHDSTAREDLPETEPSAPQQSARESIDHLVVITPEEVLIEPALETSWEPKTRWERAQWRAIETIDDDIDEALDALENNPAWVRAGSVVSGNRELKRDKLKTLYAERTL